MPIIDLSHPLTHGQPTFPGDPALSITTHGTLDTLGYNISRIETGSHQGTHLDATAHFFDDGRTLDSMPLDWFYGTARVLRIPKAAREEIGVEDLMPFEEFLVLEAKIIFETGWHRRFGAPEFFEDFPSLTQDAARFLALKKIRLIGMDMPTPSRDWLEVHQILLDKNAEIVIVESLANLDQLPDDFTFCGFPLNLSGRDGSPIRAVAIV